MTVQSRLTNMESELKALKQTMPISVGALRFPDTAPSASYTGTIDTTSQDYVIARLEATFTRSDGKQIAPMVDFAYDISISPTYTQYMAPQGVTITGNDPNVMAEFYIRGYENATGNDSVTFNVDVLNAIAPYAGASATITVTVQALSTLEGTLTLTRTI